MSRRGLVITLCRCWRKGLALGWHWGRTKDHRVETGKSENGLENREKRIEKRDPNLCKNGSKVRYCRTGARRLREKKDDII